jgi:hypothetical protein
MSNKQYPEVVYPLNKFEDEHDTLIVTGELLWCKLNKDFLDKDNKYKVSVKISEKTFKELSKKKLEGGRKLCGLKKVYEKDEDGDDTDTVDYYQITMTQNAFFTKDGEKQTWEVPVRTKKSRTEQFTDMVGNGSTGRVKGSVYWSDFEGTKQASLNLNLVQILELVEYQSKSAFDDFDFDEEDEGETLAKSDPTDGMDFDEEASEDDPFAD